MKFRQRKKNILNKLGRVAHVFCNANSKNQPVAEFINDYGNPSYCLLVNDPKTIPTIGERWFITYTKSGKFKALRPALPKQLSEAKMREIVIFVDRLFPKKDGQDI